MNDIRLDLRLNPVRRVRTQHGKGINDIAKDAGVHWQGWYLTENGVYAHIPPKILDHLCSLGESSNVLAQEYAAFISTQRAAFKEKYERHFTLEGLGVPTRNRSPVEHFRRTLHLSRLGFCKALCVQPGVLYRMEHGQSRSLPQQVRDALREVGMADTLIQELDTRIEEYYYERAS